MAASPAGVDPPCEPEHGEDGHGRLGPGCQASERRRASSTCRPRPYVVLAHQPYCYPASTPALVAILREHLGEYGTDPEGRLFTGQRGSPLAGVTYARLWAALARPCSLPNARKTVLTPEQHASPLARGPYDIRHGMAVSGDVSRGLVSRFEVLLPHLNERQQRLALATEARLLGHGGVRAGARAAGVSETTVRRGVAELEAGVDRCRRVGPGAPVGAGARPSGSLPVWSQRCWRWSSPRSGMTHRARCGGPRSRCGTWPRNWAGRALRCRPRHRDAGEPVSR